MTTGVFTAGALRRAYEETRTNVIDLNRIAGSIFSTDYKSPSLRVRSNDIIAHAITEGAGIGLGAIAGVSAVTHNNPGFWPSVKGAAVGGFIGNIAGKFASLVTRNLTMGPVWMGEAIHDSATALKEKLSAPTASR